MFLFDVRPDPVGAGPVVALALLAVVVLILTAILIVAFVFLLKWLKRRKRTAAAIDNRSRLNQPVQTSDMN